MHGLSTNIGLLTRGHFFALAMPVQTIFVRFVQNFWTEEDCQAGQKEFLSQTDKIQAFNRQNKMTLSISM